MQEWARKNSADRRILLNRVLIVEVIVCYMAVLTVISHMRGPTQYLPLTEEPLLTAADFVSSSEMETSVASGSGLWVSNDAFGVPAVYTADMLFVGMERLHVSAVIDCPEVQAGNVLHFDLWGEGYDYDEQEYQAVLSPGKNTLLLVLNLGGNAPEQGKFRIFTLDAADYEIRDLLICEMLPQSKVSVTLGGTTAVLLFILAGTFLLRLWSAKPENSRK